MRRNSTIFFTLLVILDLILDLIRNAMTILACLLIQLSFINTYLTVLDIDKINSPLNKTYLLAHQLLKIPFIRTDRFTPTSSNAILIEIYSIDIMSTFAVMHHHSKIDSKY